MSKTKLYISITIVSVNLLICFLILPYAQNTANSHTNIGPFLGTILYIISGLMFLFGLNKLIRQKDFTLFIILLGFAVTLTFWGYRLQSLMCLGCLNSG